MTNYNDYSTSAYGRMISDERRTAPFVEALRQSVVPGSVVLDIGTGTGIFSFLACQLGAKRVYAIEADAHALEVARLCARNIPGSERITWLHGLSTTLELPERVDVAVGDLHGTLPFFKNNIESMADARKRHLKPEGRLIPHRDTLLAAPAHAPSEYRHVEAPWRQNAYGIDLSQAIPMVVNQWWRAEREPIAIHAQLAAPEVWGVVEYGVSQRPEMDRTLQWPMDRDGLVHGLHVWFDGDLGGGIGYSNAPTLPELVYGRGFFPLERPLQVEAGDLLETRLTAKPIKGDHVYRWDTRLIGKDGVVRASFRQSTFKAVPRSLEQLAKSDAEHAPILSENGQVARHILEGLAESRQLRDIASDASARFPHYFKDAGEALDAVTRLARQYA